MYVCSIQYKVTIFFTLHDNEIQIVVCNSLVQCQRNDQQLSHWKPRNSLIKDNNGVVDSYAAFYKTHTIARFTVFPIQNYPFAYIFLIFF